MKTSRSSYYVINSITMYRLVSAPFLLLLVSIGQYTWFNWLITFSFLTDAIDGPLSRKYKATSVFGSRLDSVADDATIFVATIALIIVEPAFFQENWIVIVGLFELFGIQMVAALIAYRKVTSFHTYFAKTAAVAQAAFFIAFFFDLNFYHLLFTVAATITAIQLIEEIILVIVLSEWEADVKGLYWVLGSKNKIAHSK